MIEAIAGTIRPRMTRDGKFISLAPGEFQVLQLADGQTVNLIYKDKLPAKPHDLVSNAVIVLGEHSDRVQGAFRTDAIVWTNGLAKTADLVEAFQFLIDTIGSRSKAAHVIEYLGSEAKSRVVENPYCIVDVDGVGFKTADKAAVAVWGSPLDRFRKERIAAALRLAVHEQCTKTGSTVVQKPHVMSLAMGSQFLDIPTFGEGRDMVEAVLPDAVDIGDVIEHQLPYSKGLGVRRLVRAERNIAKVIKEKLQGKAFAMYSDRREATRRVAMIEKKLGFDLADSQRDALTSLLLNPVNVMTGGPGTGKTTITKAFVDCYEGRDVLLVAPTGRAAQRMSEATGREASTIHRAFMVGPKGPGVSPEDLEGLALIVVDEASMLDVALARIIFACIPASTHVLLVGDIDQLPSIGPGNVLSDLIDDIRVPTVRLTKTMRQAEGSHIIAAAKQFNAGHGIPDDLSGQHDFLYVSASDEGEALEYVRAVFDQVLPSITLKGGRACDPINDVQAITPYNDKNDVSRWALSQHIQSFIAPGVVRAVLRPGPSGREFQNPHEMVGVGDKVIHTKNNYDVGVMNGEIGVVVQMTPDRKGNVQELRVAFDPHDKADPARIVTYYDGPAYGDKEAQKQMRKVDKGSDAPLGEITCASAITVHKSQGSQFPVVICIVPRSGGNFVSRRLVYTAMTRAQEKLIVIAVRDAIALASAETGTPRNTTLKSHFEEIYAVQQAAE